MITSLFKNKIITINDHKIKLRHGFYEVGEIQDKLDLLLVTAKLLDYNITSFFMKNNTGFYLNLTGSNGMADFNFFMKRKKIYAVHVFFGSEDDGIFYVGNQKGLNKELNKILHWL